MGGVRPQVLGWGIKMERGWKRLCSQIFIPTITPVI